MQRSRSRRSPLEELLEVSLWLVDRAIEDQKRIADLQRRLSNLEQRAGASPMAKSRSAESGTGAAANAEPIHTPEALERQPARERSATPARAANPSRLRRFQQARPRWTLDPRWTDVKLVGMIALGVLATLTLVSIVLLAVAAYL